MTQTKEDRKNLIAQWAFDTRPILGRFHLWLEDVWVDWMRGEPRNELLDSISFVDERMEKLFVMTAAVTALGTRLFGRYAEGAQADKRVVNQVKKDADAISAYAMSESLWYLSRSLPENHAIMVCLGEGLMPKAGETPEMGANPLLGFGRIYARPQIAQFLDGCVQRLINSRDYTWANFREEIRHNGVKVWGTAIDTLENTSRFAKGSSTGPMTVLHVFDQPLAITDQYEGYIGNLILPKEVVLQAQMESMLIDFFTPREKVLQAIQSTYPGIKTENIHVWTLRGKSREPRIGKIWQQWERLAVHLVNDGWKMANGCEAFTESGTYAPTFRIGTWRDGAGETHLFIVDGYAASAEAIQAASLYPVLNLEASLAVFSSKFNLSCDREVLIMQLDPEAKDFVEKLTSIFGKEPDAETVQNCRQDILQARKAGIPLNRRTITADDFFPEKQWDVLAVAGYMLDDPYAGAPGVKVISEDTFEVTARLSTRKGDKLTTFRLRLLESFEESRLVFNPLLNRFLKGEDYRNRAVKISDSGRIRNELQTLCSTALEHGSGNKIRVWFDRIPEDVINKHERALLRDVLEWYKANHPIWFSWLEIA